MWFVTIYLWHPLKNFSSPLVTSGSWMAFSRFHRPLPTSIHHERLSQVEKGHLKQVPLAFVFMKRREVQDYKAVFDAIKGHLGVYTLTHFVSDFEEGLWHAVAKCFPNSLQYGWLFHWKQCQWKRLRKLGLVKLYNNNKWYERKTIQTMMCLSYLPHASLKR